MKLAIIGSRSFNNYELLKIEVNKIKNVTCVVSGGAYGADYLGKLYAKENNLEYIEFKPNWDEHGKKAGFLRNIDIINTSDIIIAFWDGLSSGTLHSINLAKKYNKKIIIIRV